MDNYFDYSQGSGTEEYTGRSGVGPIPPNSVVLLQMNIRKPKDEVAHPKHPEYLLVHPKKGAEQLDVEFTVVSDCQFSGRRFWEYLTMGGPTDGHKQAAAITRSLLRSILESANGVDPKDASPEAEQRRMVRDFADLQGVAFPAILTGAWEESWRPEEKGKFYYQNSIKKPFSASHADPEQVAMWHDLMQGGAYISEDPIPPTPEKPKQASHMPPAGGAAGAKTPPPRGAYTPPTRPQSEDGKPSKPAFLQK